MKYLHTRLNKLVDIINIDDLGFPLDDKKIIHSLSKDKAAEKAKLVEKHEIYALILKLIEKEKRNAQTRDIQLSTEEKGHLVTSRLMAELQSKINLGNQLDAQDDEFYILNQKYLFSQQEKDRLAEIKAEQVQSSITSFEKCNACGKKQSNFPSEVFQQLMGVKIHISIPINPILCELCYSEYKPLADKAKTTSEKKVFCIHCNKTLENSKTPLLSEFKDKYAVRTLCIECYMDGKTFEECSICYGKKPTIYTSENQSICLIHGYLLKYHEKTQEESNVVNIGTEEFNNQ